MKVHEHQGKTILSKYGIPIPTGRVCFSAKEAVDAAKTIQGNKWVVKAQIHAGGRGKGGGVQIANSISEVEKYFESMFGMTLITHQTGIEGKEVNRILIEEGVEIQKEFYLGLVIDRKSQKVVIMASQDGGTEIEEVAATSPEKIFRVEIDPEIGLTEEQGQKLVLFLEIPEESQRLGIELLSNLYTAFWSTDASLIEINPLILTRDKKLLALDAKCNFDSNALYRQPSIVEMRDITEENLDELEADKVGLNYISLDGNIGCLVNGAGLAMATMDIIKLYGGSPANFLDVGGGASSDQVAEAFKIMLRNRDLKAILVNIFGGIMKCDVVAEGLVKAAGMVDLKIPLIARLEGTNVESGRKILDESSVNLITATSMADAAEKAVEVARRS